MARDGPRPIADQIGTQLRALIESGRLRSGDRLPPVRVLAGFLRVNRNTVAKVYAALERAGVLSTTPGRGTFVTAPVASGKSDALLPLIDRLLREARHEGVSAADVAALVSRRAGDDGRRPRVGFVECNVSDLAYFSRQVGDRLHIPLTPVLLGDLKSKLDDLDIIATTMFHIEEVRRSAPNHEVVGLMALPEFATLAHVAGIAPDARVALVCATEEGVRSKAQSIRAVGLKRPRLATATLLQPDRLKTVLASADVVLASPKVLERIAADIPPQARVIPFASVLGDEAMQLLEQRIHAWTAS